MNKINIDEIAKIANVSKSTVSRALNNSGYVSTLAKEKIYKIVDELDYRQNMLAKKLRSSSTKFIGLIIPDIANDFFARLAKSIETGLRSAGYALFLCNTDENPEHEDFYVNSLLDHQVEAIILTPSRNTLNERLFNSTVPLVLADRFVTNQRKNTITVTSSNRLGGELAAEVLIDSGAKHIAIIKDYRSVSSASRDRVLGFQDYLQLHGLETLSFDCEVSQQSSYELTKKILKEHFLVDAVFCTSDIMAIGSLKAATEMGRSIPSDLQIIGFDGISIDDFLPTPLTTIVQDITKMGNSITKNIIDMIDGKVTEEVIEIPIHLAKRATTKQILP